MMILLSIGVIPLGCAARTEEVSISGKITKLESFNDAISILVESEINEGQYDKAIVTVTKTTKIYIGKEKGALEDITEGQHVEIVFTGAVRESYPVQADAKSVTIVE